MNVLLDLRPAFDGYSGIPQETRLLFRGLADVPGVSVTGLLQSSNLVVDRGAPAKPVGASALRAAVGQYSQVVVSLQQGPAAHRFEHLRKKALRAVGPLGVALGGLVGARVGLTHFDATHFKDFTWRALFANSLEVGDMDVVTSREFRVLRWPWSLANAVGVATSWLGHALYPKLDTRGFDVLLVETPYPGRVARGTQMVVRYHDAVPVLMPHTVKDRGYHRDMHLQALKRNAADGAWFACVSESSRRDLLSILPEVQTRSVTIPNMVSRHFVQESAPASRVAEILWSRRNRQAPHANAVPPRPGDAAPRYLLMVSTIEPRKNHATLLDAWEMLRAEDDPDLQLVCVGSLGWSHETLMLRFQPWLARGGLHLLEGVPAPDLRLLYRHAQATVCPSYSEGFDFAGVEAMSSGGVVASSDIAVHREIYADASAYFSPYDARGMADTIRDLIAPAGQAQRDAQLAAGLRIAQRHRAEAVVPQWQAFLRGLGEQCR